jgi:regulator of sirC expression with transglutaminase-like and TPR domain
MTASNRARFAEVTRREPVDLGLACMLLAAEPEPDLDVDAQVAILDRLAEQARPVVAPATTGGPSAPGGKGAPVPWDPRAVADGLRAALGDHAGFHGVPEDYEHLRSSLLPQVLRRRRGLPILLSVVWLEVARRLGIDAYPVGLPGHVVVGVGTPGQSVLVDPFAGGRIISVHEAAEKVRATGTPFTRGLLAPLPPTDPLMRVLTNIRVFAARTEAPRTKLWAVELSLLLPHHPVGLRKERGELLIQLGDFLGGASELEAFAGAVDPVEPAAAAAARRGARTARSRLN